MAKTVLLEQTKVQGRPVTVEIYLIVVLALLLTPIALMMLGTKEAKAAGAIPNFTYSCVNTHCYGRNLWAGNTNGAEMDVDVEPMNGGDGAVTNEVWVTDNGQNPNCNIGLGASFCWVEAGYVSRGSTEVFVWADVRPCGCGGYHEHDSAPLSTADFGNLAFVGVQRGGPQSCTTDTSTWCVSIIGQADSMSGLSTSNTMSASNILMGQELIGTSGVFAPTAHFIFNEWIDSSGNVHLQTTDGQLDPCFGGICTPNNSPWSGWVSGQDPAHTTNGGTFYTCSLQALPGNKNPC